MTGPGRSFGEDYREALGSGPRQGQLAQQRARLLRTVEAPATGTRRGKLAWAIGAPVTVAAAALLFLLSTGGAGEPVTSQLDGVSLVEGSAIQTARGPRELVFSEGSSILLEQNSQIRVARLGTELAELKLARGALEARITPRTRSGIGWTIAAGNYRVRVVGTHFLVQWNPVDQRLHVAVREGVVRVSGGATTGEVELTAGQSLTHGLEQPEPPSVATTATGARTGTRAGRTDRKVRVRRAPRITPREPQIQSPDWRSLARRGEYRAALAAAEDADLKGLSRSLPANDLLLLANTARLAAAPDQAKLAYLSLRRRFAGHGSAQLAAFSLGRMAADVQDDPRAAVRWFRTFLGESPRGDLAAGARARLMNLLMRIGDRNAARAVARDYLRYHGQGPHAEAARGLADLPSVK